MQSATLEPRLLAVDDILASPDGVRDYVERLIDWKAMLDEPSISLYMSRRTAELLFEGDHYSYVRISLLLKMAGIEEYDPKTINQLVMALLQLTPTFEDFFELEEVLASEIILTPDLVCGITMPAFKAELVRLLILTAVVSHYPAWSGGHALVVQGQSTGLEVKVEAIIHDLECSKQSLAQHFSPPDRIEAHAFICGRLEHFLLAMDSGQILSNSLGPADVSFAVRLALYKAYREDGEAPEWAGLPKFAIGREFVLHLAHCSEGRPGLKERCLRAMVETIKNESLADTHAIRRDKGANSEQVSRGPDKAWRRDIDHEYHLHYWQCPGRRIEFACIVPHGDIAIPR